MNVAEHAGSLREEVGQNVLPQIKARECEIAVTSLSPTTVVVTARTEIVNVTVQYCHINAN